MKDEKIKTLIVSFLKFNYPIVKAKYKLKIKRCIILEDGKLSLLDKTTIKNVEIRLIEILKLVFSFDELILKIALKSFLPPFLSN